VKRVKVINVRERESVCDLFEISFPNERKKEKEKLILN